VNAPFILEPAIDWRAVYIKLRPKIEKALKIGDDTYSFIDLAVAIEEGRFKLFYCANAILVVEIVHFPRYKTANFFVTAGRLSSVFDLEDRATEWARDQGCKYVSMTGRHGWLRTLHPRGWKMSDKISMHKEL
jgi:hypothetical protein